MLENMIDLSYGKIITVNEIHEIGLEFILFFMKYTNDKEQFVINILLSMDSLIENSFYKHLIYELKYLVESLNIATPDYPLLTGDEIFSIDNYL